MNYMNAKRLQLGSHRLTKEEKLDWAYGNLACTTNHRPVREAFLAVALDQGWTISEFDAWAKGRNWR